MSDQSPSSPSSSVARPSFERPNHKRPSNLEPLAPVEGGAPPFLDLLGRPIGVGDTLLLPTVDLKLALWHVERVQPNIHPNAPPNTVVVTVVTKSQMVVPVGQPLRDVARVQQGPSGVVTESPAESPGPAAPTEPSNA